VSVQTAAAAARVWNGWWRVGMGEIGFFFIWKIVVKIWNDGWMNGWMDKLPA
jgi:hypothetical protein